MFGWRPELAQAHVAMVRRDIRSRGLPADFADAAPNLVGLGDGKTLILHEAATRVLGGFLQPQNQPRGTCTSRGGKRANDLDQCITIATGRASIKFAYMSHAVLYGVGREKAGMLGGNPNNENDDGCTGAAIAWAMANVGNLTNEDVGDDDNDDRLACLWGAKGCPAEIKAKAAAHKARHLVQARSADDVRDAVVAGYPVTVASDVGYEGVRLTRQTMFSRDSEGRAHRGGSWNHQMVFTGYRADKDWFLVDQSWGKTNPDGPKGTMPIPDYSFWVLRSDASAMVGQGDTWIVGEIDGIPDRKLDWLI